MNIDEFTPTREDDKTIWYLDLLETQLRLTKDMIGDLKEYQDSIRGNLGYEHSKEVKATHYELASNTRFVNDQIEALSNIFYLIKQDVEHRAIVRNQSESTRNFDNIPQGLLKSQESIDTAGLAINISHQSTIDTGILRQLESTKNELYLCTKIKNTLEQQLQEYKRQQTHSDSKDKKDFISTISSQKLQISELTEIVQNLKSDFREETFTNDKISAKLDEAEVENSKHFHLIIIERMSKVIDSLNNDLTDTYFKMDEQEKQIKALSKPTVEQMKRDIFAGKSKSREKDTQITDLKDRIVTLEKENEK
jgi:hypothetical protein